MNNSTPHEPHDVLQRAETALRARAHGATPPLAVLDRTLRSLENPSIPVNNKKGFWTMKKIFGTSLTGAIAAAIAIAFIWTIFQQGSRLALADIIENVEQVQSVKMKIHTVTQMGGQTVIADGTQYIDEAHHRLRQEMQLPAGPVTNIFDMQAGKGLMLMDVNKAATRLDLAHVPKNQGPNDMLAQLKGLQQRPAKDLGEKEFNGRKLHGFLATDTQNDTTTETAVWADEKTKMPIVVEQTVRNGFLPTVITLRDFEWNWPIDESLLALNIPDGYTVGDAPFDMAKPAESDLLKALKASTVFNNGKFPAGLTLNDIGAAMYNSLADKSQVKQKMLEHAGDMLVVARGWAYISDPDNGTDWHWAGTDVSLNTKDHPILWYKPKGQSTFTIINADLTTHTSATEPDVPATPIDPAHPGPPAP
jgi:outer membrane lipoprotein-sorting protein